MKRLIGIMICFLFAVALSGNVFAKPAPVASDIFMTDTSGGYAEKAPPHNFLSSETPWVSIELGDSSIVTGSWWVDSSTTYDFTSLLQDGSYTNGGFTFFNSYADDRIWLSPTDWLSGVGEAGTWHINGDVVIDGEHQDTHSINFKVTAVPEPVSTILFLTGGAVLAVRRLRKKNKKINISS